MEINDTRNQATPFLVDDIEVAAVLGDIDPYNDGSPTVCNQSRYLDHGFLVRPDTNGSIRVVTWADYNENDNVVVDANAVTITGCVTFKWEECRIVKVFQTGTDSTNILVGILT